MTQTSFALVRARLDARINWERRDRSKGWKVALDPMRDLLRHLGNPEAELRLIHVAGSKGKGSVSSLVTHALVAAGHPTGTYGSPHVESITERIRLDGVNITEEALGRAITIVIDAVEAAEDAAADASWFDIMTGAGLVAFRDAGMEFAVLEVGLGGRLDSTNAIPAPEVAAVTTILLEHTEILGKTHAAIAREKGGIAKRGSHFITGCAPDSEAGVTLAEVAAAADVASHITAWDQGDDTFDAANTRVAGAILAALEERGVARAEITPEVASAARLPGRMEQRAFDGVPVVLDGAHVPESLQSALAQARRSHPGPCFAVVAVHREKDSASLLAPLASVAAGAVATTIPGSGVHRDAEELLPHLGDGELMALEHPGEALGAALGMARRVHGGWIFVTGSLYLVGAVRGELDPVED